MLYQLRRKINLAISIDEAWQFFSNPQNLPIITPPSLNFKITSPLEDQIYAGQIIAYKVSPVPYLPVTWVTEITHVAAPYVFVDEQRYGPYRLWHHRHSFREISGGVEVQDLVSYILPFGVLGQIVHALFIEQKLNFIFDYRSKVLEEKFGIAKQQT